MFEYAFKERLIVQMSSGIISSAMEMTSYFGSNSLVYVLVELWIDNTPLFSLSNICQFLENNLEYFSEVCFKVFLTFRIYRKTKVMD